MADALTEIMCLARLYGPGGAAVAAQPALPFGKSAASIRPVAVAWDPSRGAPSTQDAGFAQQPSGARVPALRYMTHWFDELRHQFERRGLSLILKGDGDREWIATAWHRLARMQYGGEDSPVARALGATPREAALRLLMVLDDAQERSG